MSSNLVTKLQYISFEENFSMTHELIKKKSNDKKNNVSRHHDVMLLLSTLILNSLRLEITRVSRKRRRVHYYPMVFHHFYKYFIAKVGGIKEEQKKFKTSKEMNQDGEDDTLAREV